MTCQGDGCCSVCKADWAPVRCRRALDLVYALVNEGNIQSLTKELLDYLQVADADFKPDLTAKIAALVQRFAPNKRWHFDSLLQVCSVSAMSVLAWGTSAVFFHPFRTSGRTVLQRDWCLQLMGLT